MLSAPISSRQLVVTIGSSLASICLQKKEAQTRAVLRSIKARIQTQVSSSILPTQLPREVPSMLLPLYVTKISDKASSLYYFELLFASWQPSESTCPFLQALPLDPGFWTPQSRRTTWPQDRGSCLCSGSVKFSCRITGPRS
jgi:hypothetical protein